MITISIQKPKSSQMNRVMKGCGMRVVEGDYPIQVKKELARKIKNSFNKGKAHTLYSHEFEGSGLNEMYGKAKKAVTAEVRQTARQLKKEAIQTGKEMKQEAIKQGNIFVEDVARPYLKELVSAGIIGLGATATAVQPELAPWIGLGTVGATAYANSLIDSIGRPRQQPQPQEEEYGQQYIAPPPPPSMPQVFHSQIHSVADSQQGLIGYGLRYQEKKGNGLFAGGGLITHGRGLHPSLQTQNPTFYLNRNALPAYIQNQMYN